MSEDLAISEEIDDGELTLEQADEIMPLSSVSVPVRWVTVIADLDNDGLVSVGGPQVAKGAVLEAGDSVDVDNTNLNKVFGKGSLPGQKVSFIFHPH